MILINVCTGNTSIMDKWDHLKNNFILGLTEAWSNDKLPNEIFQMCEEYSFVRNYKKKEEW